MVHRGLHKRIYSPYQDCINYKGWIHVSQEQSKNARRFLKKVFDSHIIHVFHSDKADYLIDGCLVRTQNASCSNLEDGWNFKVYAETVKALESILGRLGLPMESGN